jgi:hypothetical protein
MSLRSNQSSESVLVRIALSYHRMIVTARWRIVATELKVRVATKREECDATGGQSQEKAMDKARAPAPGLLARCRQR